MSAGELLERDPPEGGNEVALDVAFIGEEGGGPDGGLYSGQPFALKEVPEEDLGGLDVGAGGDGGYGFGQFLFGFALARISGVELLAALETIF